MIAPRQPLPSRRILLWAILAVCALASAMVARNLTLQPAGMDFLPFWTGGGVAVDTPERLYDFAYITALQPVPLAPGALRPYVNPPPALFLFSPLSRLPLPVAYGLFLALSAAVMALAARMARAPWWLFLMPAMAFAAYCGQVSVLLGGLILIALTFLRDRPLVAGLLFGVVGAIKPQFLILLPLALAAAGCWRSFLATGGTAAAICALSILVFGVEPWLDWLAALPRFSALVLGDASLLATAVTPYAALESRGWDGRWAYLLAPLALWGVWSAFRRGRPWPDQLVALVGGALLISPYAMTYELALLAPAVAAYLARTDHRRWMLIAALTLVYATDMVFGVLSLVAVLFLPLIGSGENRLKAAPA